MPRYRKRPVEIDAVLFRGLKRDGEPMFGQVDANDGWLAEALQKPSTEPGALYVHGSVCLMIQTLEGPMTCSPGDYVLRGTAGEIYACKPDIFNAINERVSE